MPVFYIASASRLLFDHSDHMLALEGHSSCQDLSHVAASEDDDLITDIFMTDVDQTLCFPGGEDTGWPGPCGAKRGKSTFIASGRKDQMIKGDRDTSGLRT